MAWLAKNAFHYLKKSAAVAQSPGVSQGVGRETTMSLPDRRCSDNSLRHSYVPVRSGERGRFGSLVQMRLDQSWPLVATFPAPPEQAKRSLMPGAMSAMRSASQDGLSMPPACAR